MTVSWLTQVVTCRPRVGTGGLLRPYGGGIHRQNDAFLLGEPMLELLFDNLSHRVAGQGLDPFDLLRMLVAGEPVRSAVLGEVLDRHGRSRLDNDYGAHPLARAPVGKTDDGDV